MAKLTLNTIGSRYGSIDALNDNFDIIEQAFENTLSRDGTGPNTLEATLDANSQRIVNLPDPVNNTEPATKGWVLAQPNQAAASAAAAAISEANAEAAAEQVVDWEWKDEWATGVLYKVNNIIAVPSGTYEGWSFICVVEHTAGATFSTDFSAGKWDVLAKRGAAGAGTGDMLAANNLSELTNVTAARTNLGVPSTTGTNASGSWGIDITGSAAKLSTASGSAPSYSARAWVSFNGAANSNATGTYTQSGTLVTVTINGHGYVSGQTAQLDFTSGTAVDGAYTVTVTGLDTFTVTQASRTTSGNVTDLRNTIRSSGNVSSISDNGTGLYTIHLTTAMADTNYAVVASTTIPGTVTKPGFVAIYAEPASGSWSPVAPTSTSFKLAVYNDGGASADAQYITAALFR
jgi:hypothetical protein